MLHALKFGPRKTAWQLITLRLLVGRGNTTSRVPPTSRDALPLLICSSAKVRGNVRNNVRRYHDIPFPSTTFPFLTVPPPSLIPPPRVPSRAWMGNCLERCWGQASGGKRNALSLHVLSFLCVQVSHSKAQAPNQGYTTYREQHCLMHLRAALFQTLPHLAEAVGEIFLAFCRQFRVGNLAGIREILGGSLNEELSKRGFARKALTGPKRALSAQCLFYPVAVRCGGIGPEAPKGPDFL